MGNYQQIGEILVRKGKITRHELEIALQVRHNSRQRLGQVVTGLGFASEVDVAECLAEQFGFNLVDPQKLKPQMQALRLLPGQLALAHRILPLKYSRDSVECVMADPIDFPTTDMIARLAGRRIAIYIAPATALMDAIADAYRIPSPASRRKAARPAPKHQDDRDAILAHLDSAAQHITTRAIPGCATNSTGAAAVDNGGLA